MPKDMRTEKHHQTDFAILGRIYEAALTCCLWNATDIISNSAEMSSISAKFNIFSFRPGRSAVSSPAARKKMKSILRRGMCLTKEPLHPASVRAPRVRTAGWQGICCTAVSGFAAFRMQRTPCGERGDGIPSFSLFRPALPCSSSRRDPWWTRRHSS